MDTIVSLVALLGMGYGLFRGIKWMMRAGQVQAAKDAPLSPTDLKVLEESAARLMADLRSVTDECVARIERACTEAQVRIEMLEGKDAVEHIVTSAQPLDAWPTAPASVALSALDMNETSSVIARESGMTTGEIELLRGLRAIESHN